MNQTTAVFDTLEFDEKLVNAGFSDQQAKALTKAIASIVSADTLVTKSYLDVRLAELKNDLIKYMLGFLGAQAAIIITCIKLIH